MLYIIDYISLILHGRKLSITLQEVVLMTAGGCLLHCRKSSLILRLQEVVYVMISKSKHVTRSIPGS